MALALFTGYVFADPVDYDEGLRAHKSISHQLNVSTAKADTTVAYYCDFSDPLNPSQGDPLYNGWITVDYTDFAEHWHIDTFNAENLNGHGAGNHAMWAGETFPVACDDNYSGYGNFYNCFLDWWGTVPDTEENTTVRVDAYLNVETELGWDWLYLQYEDATGSMAKFGLGAAPRNGLSGDSLNVHVDLSVPIATGEYVDGDQVHLRWLATSDSNTSDADCLRPSDGHTQVDDIAVYFDQGLGEVQMGVTNTFEDGVAVEWASVKAPYCGDFADVWDILGDVDPCIDNTTPQMAFIDYGQVTGEASTNTEWTYGPGGYVTNYTYGMAGTPDYALDNAIWSPPIAIDATAAGNEIRFSVYRHFDLHSMAGQFYTWRVRSSIDGVIYTAWRNRMFVYYGGPDYIRVHQDVSDLVYPGANWAQISLEVTTPWTAYMFGGSTPAPYYDDVSWHYFDYSGPAYSTRQFELAQDNFPHDGDGLPQGMDWGSLGTMDVPFNMGQDIIGAEGAGILHGDTIIVNIDAVRAGSGLDAKPRMYYEVRTNPVFDTDPLWRSSGVPYSGFVEGDTVWYDETTYYAGRWAFELPDYDFLYPGDVMHYYFSASDTVGVEAPVFATLPADTAGFGYFEGDAGFVPWQWDSNFTVHALPSVLSTTVGDIPEILLWNDFGDRGGENEWEGALKSMGLERGTAYDLYYTNGPSSGTGNGLGSTCTGTTLSLYDHMLYTAGDLAGMTMTGTKVPGTEDPFDGDGSNDIALVKSYLLGGGDLLATGDGFIGGVFEEPDGSGVSLVNSYFGINFIKDDVRLSIGNQSAPTVGFVANATALVLSEDFVAYGSCPNFKMFDGISENANPTSHRVAEFLGADGTPGVYPDYAAMVVNELPTGAKVVTCPIDLNSWYTPYGPGSKVNAPAQARVIVLCDVLQYFNGDPAYCDDHIGSGTGVDLPHPFYAKNWPNPFNPITKIEFSLPRGGHVSLKVYNVRGELVRTLVDENRIAGPHVIEWDGSNDRGHSVASGVYFYETRTAGKSTVNKMALVK